MPNLEVLSLSVNGVTSLAAPRRPLHVVVLPVVLPVVMLPAVVLAMVLLPRWWCCRGGGVPVVLPVVLPVVVLRWCCLWCTPPRIFAARLRVPGSGIGADCWCKSEKNMAVFS